MQFLLNYTDSLLPGSTSMKSKGREIKVERWQEFSSGKETNFQVDSEIALLSLCVVPRRTVCSRVAGAAALLQDSGSWFTRTGASPRPGLRVMATWGPRQSGAAETGTAPSRCGLEGRSPKQGQASAVTCPVQSAGGQCAGPLSLSPVLPAVRGRPP